MTKVEFLNDVIENYEGISDEGREVAEKMIAQLQKKYASNGKPTKRQVENEDIKVRIREYLDTVERASATEIGNAVDVSCQRASALLKQMEIPKFKEKGKVFYTVNPADEGEDE